MHIDRTDKVAVSREPARFADPLPVSRLVFMLTFRTLAACSSFGASEALNVSLVGFVGQVVDIFAVFPQAHTLVVVASIVLLAHPIRVANEEGPDVVFDTKVKHFTGGLMPLVTNAALGSSRMLVFGPLQLLPTTRVFGASSLFLADRAQGFGASSFE